jgi:hypothetical protein
MMIALQAAAATRNGSPLRRRLVLLFQQVRDPVVFTKLSCGVLKAGSF